MKIIPISDIHLETGNKIDKVIPTETPDVFVLAGDIHNGNRAEYALRILAARAPVIYVLGNHEFYNHRFPDIYDSVKQIAASINSNPEMYPHPIHVLQNESVTISGVKFVGCTLWSDFDGESLSSMNIARYSMRDYNTIRYGEGEYVNPGIFLAEFKKSMKFLSEHLRLSNEPGKVVVVTHHSPSFKGVSTEFEGNVVNGSFHSNLDDFILAHQPDVWIHGHTHTALDYNIGKTRIVCNPYGYPFEHNVRLRGYNLNKVIEL